MFKLLITAAAMAAAAPAFAVAQVSSPASFTAASVDTSLTTTYNGFVEEGLVAGLTSTTVFTLTSISGDKRTWEFDLSVSNTSSGAITASRVSGFGFNVSPGLSGASGEGLFDVVGRNGNVPQIGDVSVCFRAGGGGNNCAGGGGNGVDIGQTYSDGSFVLRFAQATESLILDNFYVRYQSIAGTDRGTSGVGVDDLQSDGSGSGAVPEPGTWAMLIAGFGVVGAARRRQRGRAMVAC